MMRFTKAQIQAPGNPHDVPYEKIVRALRADKGNRCSKGRCKSDRMTSAQRITRATAATDVDSYDNLELVCPKHATDDAPEYTRILATAGRKRR